MMEKRRGAIINVSSLASFFPMPGGTTYSATKAYLNSFSESLQMELSDFGIQVQALCPGMTHSDFHRKMGAHGDDIRKRYFLNWMDPDTVVRKSLRHLGSKRVLYIPGTINKAIARVMPKIPRRLYYPLVTKVRG